MVLADSGCLGVQRMRPNLSREEIELTDVERQMEQQLIAEHKQVERIFAIRCAPGLGFPPSCHRCLCTQFIRSGLTFNQVDKA